MRWEMALSFCWAKPGKGFLEDEGLGSCEKLWQGLSLVAEVADCCWVVVVVAVVVVVEEEACSTDCCCC